MLLDGYKTLQQVTALLDGYLAAAHPSYFGPGAHHPAYPIKSHKIVHDPFWGTNRFSWRELALIDSPLLQRLRFIHQTGLAFQVYPSARHTRFEHSLGVATIASRVFDALVLRFPADVQTIAAEISKIEPSVTLAVLRQELRMAALLHDTGHSLFSHASERAFSKIELVAAAAEELSDLVGAERPKGAGEVLSFCFAQTNAVAGLLKRAQSKVIGKPEDLGWSVDLDNVSLLIVGRSKHPHLQFMGDLISSGLDSDKLDYLLRDASSAGLPLRYDLERYLFTVALEKDFLVDVDGALTKLYSKSPVKSSFRSICAGKSKLPSFDTYRLRIPKRASSTIEQIVICKVMLFSYIYHHQKVRAAEGLLEHLLVRMMRYWREEKKSDSEILLKFIDFQDAALWSSDFLMSERKDISSVSYRLINRHLPREIYRLGSAVTHAEGALIQEFLLNLRERAKREDMVKELEKAIGSELRKINGELGAGDEEALWTTGVWVDAPKPPQVEEVELSTGGNKTISIENIFPVEEWTEAYQAHRYYVRIFAFSEYAEVAELAARRALESVTKIKTDEFYESCKRNRN